jgi:hypothetical protein
MRVETMTFRKTLLVVSFTLICGFHSLALASPDSDFQAQAQADFQTIAGFMNGPFINSMGFFTGLGWDVPPTVYDFVSGPHFELSVGAGADFIPLPNLGSLSLPAVSASTNLSLPSGIPLPYPVATARIGLFNGFDAGFRYTYLPSISAAGVGGNFTGWGIDLRYKLFEGMELPTVTLSTSYDTMTGNFSVSTPNINQSGTYTDNGTQYSSNLTGNSNYALNWNTKSVGAKVMVGKSLGIFYPFAGIGFQRNSGSITSTMTGNFSESLNGGASNPFSVNAISQGSPVVLEPKYVLGFTLGGGLGIAWSVVGESNGTDIAGSTSFALLF